MYDCKRKWRWIKTSMENKYKKFTLNSQCGWWGHDSKNIFCPTRVVYTAPSCDVTSLIIRPPRDCMIRLSVGRLEFSFSHVTWGTRFPLTSHCSEAIPVSFTTMDIGGDKIDGAEMDSPGSPLPWRPWSPLSPGGPWYPWGQDLSVHVFPGAQLDHVCLGDLAFLVFPWLPWDNVPCRRSYSSPV